MYLCKHTHTHTHNHTHAKSHTLTCTRTYIHARTHTPHTHTHTQVLLSQYLRLPRQEVCERERIRVPWGSPRSGLGHCHTLALPRHPSTSRSDPSICICTCVLCLSSAFGISLFAQMRTDCRAWAAGTSAAGCCGDCFGLFLPVILAGRFISEPP